MTLNEGGAQKIGKRVKVDEAFSSGAGRVRFGDTVWAAESEKGENFEKGSEVEIVRAAGRQALCEGSLIDRLRLIGPMPVFVELERRPAAARAGARSN